MSATSSSRNANASFPPPQKLSGASKELYINDPPSGFLRTETIKKQAGATVRSKATHEAKKDVAEAVEVGRSAVSGSYDISSINNSDQAKSPPPLASSPTFTASLDTSTSGMIWQVFIFIYDPYCD